MLIDNVAIDTTLGLSAQEEIIVIRHTAAASKNLHIY